MKKSNNSNKNVPCQARRYLVTINNPQDKQITFNTIRETMAGLKSTIYYCMATEIGAETKTRHIHLYCVFRVPVRMTTLANAFHNCIHIDRPNGSHAECRAYVSKTEKWANSNKAETNLGDFEEHGELPPDSAVGGSSSSLSELYEMVSAGLTDGQIYHANAAFIRYAPLLDRVRSAIVQEEVKNCCREVEVTYIECRDGTGSKYVYDKHGFSNTYRVLNYTRGPFDSYHANPVLLLEDYRSDFELRDLTAYCSGFPVDLPARYSNRPAAYNFLYITSTIPLLEQHKNDQVERPQAWENLLSRIKTVIIFENGNQPSFYSTKDYLNGQKSPEINATANFGDLEQSAHSQQADGKDYQEGKGGGSP